MKRFWKDAVIAAKDGGHAVLLDGRGVKTPGGRKLVLPNAGLAETVASEWRAVDGEILPALMPMTGLANAAIDIVAEGRDGFAADLARYAASDLLCYRAEHPTALVQRQAEKWDPLLKWAERRFDIGFLVTGGVAPVSQPAALLERIGAAFAAMPPFPLAAMSPLVSLSGSAVIPLAMAEGAIDANEAWAASSLDELFQEEHWGSDAEAAASRASRERQFHGAAEFLRLANS